MGTPTHAMEFSSGRATMKDGGSALLQFVSPLRQLNGTDRWFLTLSPILPGQTIDDVRHGDTPEFLQAGGRADKMMLDIRRPGGEQWEVAGVRYVIGHPHDGNPPLDVAIELPRGPEFVSTPEVFEAEEAGDIFFAYYKTGDLPAGYVLRPIEGYTAHGGIVDLRGTSASS